MKFFRPYLFISIVLFACGTHGMAQNNAFNDGFPNITAEFRQENLIIEPDAPFFNLLIIENQGDRREEIFVNINIPEGWSLMIDPASNYLIEPGDSVLIPVRAAPSRLVEGEIGYSIIAAINSRDDETITNAYCFIKIPRQSSFFFRPLTRVNFFDQQTGKSEFSFQLNNRGNVSELVYLTFRSTQNVSVINEADNLFTYDIIVPARTDTVITLPVEMVEQPGEMTSRLFRIDMEGFTENSSFSTSFWFNQLSDSYKFEIPETQRMLIAELAIQNLMSNQPVTFAGGVRGNILLPENRDIKYDFYRFGSGPLNETLKYSRILLSYNTPRLNITLGDVVGIPLKYGGGKGGSISYAFNENLRVGTLYSENSFRPITNYGFFIDERYSPLNFSTRFAYTENAFLDNSAYITGFRSLIPIAPGHNLMTDAGISRVDFNQTGDQLLGYGLNLEYTGRFNTTNVRIREQFGSRYYYGYYAGRHNLSARISRPLNDNYFTELIVNDHSYRPLTETPEGIESERFVNNTRIHAVLRRLIDRHFQIFGGPIYERKSTNSFLFYDGKNPFTTQSAKVSAGFRLRDDTGLSISPNVTLGYSFVTNHSIPDSDLFPTYSYDPNADRMIFNSNISVNLRGRGWGTFLNYFYGPYAINQEISSFYYDIFSHSVRIMPYLERYIYRDLIFLTSRVGFTHDFSFRTSRINLSNQLNFQLPNNFTLGLLNTYSYQLTTDLLTEENYTYSNNYFEIRVKKEFGWNQPRIKYYDVEINLFKDLNGNLVRDFNEPGVKDILVTISGLEPTRYDDFDVDYQPAGGIVTQRLLTSMEGKVTYSNIPRGLYRIELENIGTDQDKFFPDQNEFIINVAGDKTVYVPYLERNKIFGKVILNRSRLSTLGRIEPSNIKITATDSKGRQTVTLSDANGNFEMYVPSIDNYTVSINNIFRDHFNLRQNDFRANLNGFKQFEVNFVFDEIRRQIEFTPSPTDVQAEIRRVGRTNLSGLVRDASTLQPLRARVEVVNNRTGSTVEQTTTERGTGRYTMSFATGEEYMIVVSAPGYWMHSERLILDQFLTIQDAERDILLETISIGARFQLNNLRFESESVEIPTEAKPELDRLISQLRQNPNVRIRIEGHSDALETLDYPNISMQRAETVMRYMVQNGFSNIEFTGLRDARPIAPDDTEENRRRNRRVEIIITER